MNINISDILLLTSDSYENKITSLLNLDFNCNIKKEIKNEIINIPYDYVTILPENPDYNKSVKNFINNSNSSIPKNQKLLINGIYFYYKNNNHKRHAIYAYPAGFEELNKNKKYPILTAPFQIGTHLNCKKHNKPYNEMYYTQVTILNDIKGESYPTNDKIIFCAYKAPNFEEALSQIIYVFSKFLHWVRVKFNLPIIKFNHNICVQNPKIKKILNRNKKKLYFNFLINHQTKTEQIKTIIQLNV